MAEESNKELVKRFDKLISDVRGWAQPHSSSYQLCILGYKVCKCLELADKKIEQLEKEAQLVTPDQNEMQALKERISFYKQTESKRNTELEELYSAATKALNSQVEINEQLLAENKRLINGLHAVRKSTEIMKARRLAEQALKESSK